MEQKRSARLVLKTSDLTANSTTNNGSCDQYRTSFTWFNINLRMLLGDMYNQYDYFNISLLSISCSQASAAVGQGGVEDKTVYVEMSGLPFINQTYNQPTRNNGSQAVVTIYQIPATATANTQPFNNSIVNVMTFNKDQDLCNINISFFRLVDEVKPALTVANPQFVFLFTIIGIDNADNPDRINHLMKI